MDYKASIKLFCIPYAGGLSSVYYGWKEFMDPSVQLVPLELAGRGRRSSRPVYEHIQEAVEDLFELIRPQLDGTPFAIFGHSLGALITYELARYINDRLGFVAQHVFFSGKAPLHIQSDEKRHLLSEAEFEKYIFGLGGISGELQSCRELLDLFLPIIRSDIKLVDSYVLNEADIRTLQSNISVFYGFSDPLVDPDTLEEWKLYTNANYRIHGLPGSHFFINEHPSSVIGIINRTLEQYRGLKPLKAL